MDDWFDEFLLSLQPADPDVEFTHYEFTRQTRADARHREAETRRIKQEPDTEQPQPQAAVAEEVQQEGGEPAPMPVEHPERPEGQEVKVKQEKGVAGRAGEERMEVGNEAPVVIVLDSDEEDSFDEAGFKSLNLTLAGATQDDDSDSLKGRGIRHPATSDLLVDRNGVKLEKREIPKIPGYLCTRSVGRVYSPPGYLTGATSQKALRAPFIKAYQDGRYWGWSGHLKLATYPAADTKACTHQATREHLHHLYQVAHYMGQVADVPGLDQYDLSVHQEIAQVRHEVYFQG